MTEPTVNKYHTGKIYKIIAIIDGVIQPKCYIGASIQKYLCRRFAQHKDGYNNYKKGKLHKSCSSFDLFDEYGVENTKIELIEYCKCESKEELFRKELETIKSTEGCVNRHIAVFQTPSNKEEKKKHLQAYKKQYQIKNKERISAYMKNYLLRRKKQENITIEV